MPRQRKRRTVEDRADEEARLRAIDDEINTIQTRLDELASIQ